MISLSRSSDKYTGSYLAQRRRKRLTWALVVAAALAIGAGVLVRLQARGVLAAAAASRPVPKKKVLASWEGRKWDEVRADAVASLASAPLDPFFLGFGGLASFYKAMDLPEGEDRAALLDESVLSMRKALVVSGRGVPKAQLEYVLGKAYYHKGPAYFDESVKYLEASIASGYIGSDSREYLALAYAGLGDKEKAVSNFDAALEATDKASGGRSELLLLAAARAKLDAGAPDKAEALLVEAISKGTDELAREKCRFLLGDIYRARGEGTRAEGQYELILEKDPESAEAHYRLGLVYQERGDPLRARSEWRKAVALDPMHAAARQKLAEKL
jgi:tetratricopeptide (TPR) repeat protein